MAALRSDGANVVVVDVVRVVKQAADQGGFAVVDAAGGGEAEQVFGEFGFEALFDRNDEAIRFGGRGNSDCR